MTYRAYCQLRTLVYKLDDVYISDQNNTAKINKLKKDILDVVLSNYVLKRAVLND